MVVIVTQNSKTQIVKKQKKTETETKHKNFKCDKIQKF